MGNLKTDDIYEKLATALDTLPNGFPRTPSNVEIPLLQKIFSPEDASLAAHLNRDLEPVDIIAERTGLSPDQAVTHLTSMAKRGLLWADIQAGKPQFRLAPFIVGIYEAQLDAMDHDLAHLFEHYMADGGAVGIMKPQPAIHRIIPARSAAKSEWILPYDDVREILLKAKSFYARDCICRKQQDQIGRKCDFPLRMCLVYSLGDKPITAEQISREDALAILDQAEEVGLVHSVCNVREKSLFMRDIGYICNCCGCCCAILRGITDWGIEDSVAQANYYSQIDADQCAACGLCEQRCQVGAVSLQNGSFVVNRERCIGCGLCVTSCPNDAAKLQRKLDCEIISPPMDLAEWEEQRLHNLK